MIQPIDYTRKVTVPVRDMERGGRVAFLLDMYGLSRGELMIVPGGGTPMREALARRGYDTNRFVCSIFDL